MQNQVLITYATTILSLLTILSYLLAINEYYGNKAYWDFFHIDFRIRTNMRSGFHAEHLSYASVITLFFLLIDGILIFYSELETNPIIFLFNYIIVCFVLFIISLFVLYIIIWKFHLTDVNERRIWNNLKLYRQYLWKVYCLSFLKLSIPYWLIISVLYYFSIKKAYLISAFLFASAFVYLQFQNYSQRQQLIIDMKWFDITKIQNETYVVLAHNGDLLQMNKCNIYNGILYIDLDKVVIQKKDYINYQTIYINKFEKICNGSICTEHHIAGYRNGFK